MPCQPCNYHRLSALCIRDFVVLDVSRNWYRPQFAQTLRNSRRFWSSSHVFDQHKIEYKHPFHLGPFWRDEIFHENWILRKLLIWICNHVHGCSAHCKSHCEQNCCRCWKRCLKISSRQASRAGMHKWTESSHQHRSIWRTQCLRKIRRPCILPPLLSLSISGLPYKADLSNRKVER